MLTFAKMMIKHHIKRSYMIILGIACSVAMMFCMIQMGDSISNKYKEQALGTNRYDFHINGLTKEQADWLKGELDKEEIEASGILYSDYREMQMKLEGFQKMELQLCAGTKGGFEEPGLRLREGTWCELPDEVVLEQYVCDMLGSQIGDEITVICNLSGDTYRFRLVGIMENTPILASSDWTRGFLCVSFEFLYRAGLVTPEAEEYSLFITVNSDIDAQDIEKTNELEMKARELLAEPYGIDYFDTLQKALNGQASEEEKDVLGRIGGKIGFNSSKTENIEEYESQSGLGNALKAFVVLIAVAMVLLIFNSMHLTIAENTRELGMLRCIGMDYRQTGLVVFSENIFYCILGCGIGVAFGNVLNQVLAKNILYYLTGDYVEIRQLGSSYLLTAAVAFISLVMAFLLSVHKILALTPIEASKYNGLIIKNPKVRAMEKWSAVKFAGRNIRREKSKSMIVMISMIFSMMILMLIVNTISSVKLPEKDRKSKFSDYEVYIPISGIIDTLDSSSSAEISFSEMEEVKSINGVEELYAIGMGEETLYNRDDNRIPIIVYNDELFQWLLEQNGETELWEKEPDSVCVILGTCGEEEKKILDEIEETGAIAYRLNNEKDGILQVNTVLYTDYIPDYKGTGSRSAAIILTEKAASEIYADYSYLDVMIKCNSADDERTYADIIGIVSDNEYAICGSYEVGMEKIITDALAMIYIAALIAVATAVTAILNMMIIVKANLILRRKEYGVWRALGMSLKRLKETVSIEVLLMLLASYMLAVIVSFPIQCYLCNMMENWNTAGILSGYLGVGIVSILLVYFLVMSGLKFKETNEIMADIREE
ncbi:MAG: FtsX-like permease family protein [Lachnospiraceae bacterium]|nr:FtsX-like permease family protein [Lachnospiraceae bacterium]